MRSKQSKSLFLLLALVAVLLLAACGGGDKESAEKPAAPSAGKATNAQAAEATPAPTKEPAPEPEEATPEELGEEIGAVYVEALQKVTDLVESKPAVAEVKPKVEELKETYIQKLVELGKKREALGEQDKAVADSAILMALDKVYNESWYTTYSEVVQYYFDQDYEFQQLLYSFNIIGQYANFDLLKEQEPEEAARLGIMELTVAEAATPTAAMPLEPTSAAEIALGEEMRNEQGGYSFQPILDYVTEQIMGTVIMDADGADPEYGPSIIIIGGPNEGHSSVEELFDGLLEDADDSQLSNRREITVGGVPAIAVDVKSQGDEAVEVTSRMVVALGSANQQFTMFGFAPAEQWDELEPLFEQVLASISFFEPSTAPTPVPATALGEEQRSEYGGFTFRPIQGYEVAEELGMVSIFAPDGDPDIGPAILIMSLFDEEVTGLEPLVDVLTADAPDLQVSDQREVVVGDVEGVAVDLHGSDEGRALAGRIVVALPEPTRQFIMIGVAPPERWDGELEPLLEEVLASVSFFEPTAELETPEEEEEPEATGKVTRQWASSAVASSEYSDPGWAAIQATGAPDTDECADTITAWASANSDTVEWIELTYDIPVLPTEVNIVQTYSPNQVVSVDLLDTEEEYHNIYLGEPEALDECPYTLSIAVQDADYQVVGVKITIDQSVVGLWNEIDAVELVGYADHPAMTEP
jgi:hypothetical protein